MTLCETVKAVGGANLSVWLSSVDDLRLRSDLFEHVIRCPQCSRVHREALSLVPVDDNTQKRESWTDIILKPLSEWSLGLAIPVPTYGSDSDADAGATEWSLTIGAPDEIDRADIRLIRDSSTLLVQATSQKSGAAYALRGFSGAETVFDAEVKADGIPVAVDLKGDLRRDSEIEIVELR